MRLSSIISRGAALVPVLSCVYLALYSKMRVCVRRVPVCVCVCVYVCVCVRAHGACVRVRARARACVCMCARACLE